jgi:hypothetical protein
MDFVYETFGKPNKLPMRTAGAVAVSRVARLSRGRIAGRWAANTRHAPSHPLNQFR